MNRMFKIVLLYSVLFLCSCGDGQKTETSSMKIHSEEYLFAYLEEEDYILQGYVKSNKFILHGNAYRVKKYPDENVLEVTPYLNGVASAKQYFNGVEVERELDFVRKFLSENASQTNYTPTLN